MPSEHLESEILLTHTPSPPPQTKWGSFGPPMYSTGVRVLLIRTLVTFKTNNVGNFAGF